MLYVVGPSGAGKDSVLDQLMAALSPQEGQAGGLYRVRRTITRPPESGGEAHESVDEATFEQLVADEQLALHWQANGLGYGIRMTELQGLPLGQWVLVNGSRGYLPEALARFPDLWVVHITAALPVLRQRLMARGRETPQRVEARLQRTAELGPVAHSRVIEVANDTTLACATAALKTALSALPGWSDSLEKAPHPSPPAA
jgi:ribose 1,5-bisphosphokinase